MHTLSYNLEWNTFNQLISFPQLLSALSNPHLCGIIWLKYSTRFCNRNASIQSSSKHDPFSPQEKKKKWGHSSTLIIYSTAKYFTSSCEMHLFIQGKAEDRKHVSMSGVWSSASLYFSGMNYDFQHQLTLKHLNRNNSTGVETEIDMS